MASCNIGLFCSKRRFLSILLLVTVTLITYAMFSIPTGVTRKRFEIGINHVNSRNGISSTFLFNLSVDSNIVQFSDDKFLYNSLRDRNSESQDDSAGVFASSVDDDFNVTIEPEEEMSAYKDNAMIQTNQHANCNVEWMTESWYLNQIKPKPDCHQPRGKQQRSLFYRMECDPQLGRYLKSAEGKLQQISQSSWKFWKKLQNLIVPNLPLAGRWKALSDIMNSCGYEQRLPDVICIGVKKSGTTLFKTFFSKHPQIAAQLRTEVHFFDWNYEKGLEFYKSRMGFASRDMLSFEKTPRYFRTEDAPYYIVKDLPNLEHIKFILLVKDPIKRAISEFRHNTQRTLNVRKRKIVKRRDKPTKYSEGVRFEREVLLPNGEINQENEMIDTSLYSKHFENWLQYFPREKFFIIEYDKLVQNVSFILQKVEKFIGLHSFFQDDMFKLTKEKRLCFIPPSGNGDFKEDPQGKGNMVCPGNNGFLPKAKPSKRTLKKLCDFFRPFNERFMRSADMTFNWKCP